MITPRISDAKTIGAFLTWAQGSLEQASIENVSQEARWLVAAAFEVQQHELISCAEQSITPEQQTHAEALISRRMAREPIQYILESQEFCGLDFCVNSAVLIPRPDTELLVQESFREGAFAEGAVLVDVGTGSGCIAVTLASILPGVQIFALDCSEEAMAVAKNNAERHGVSDSITFMVGDLLSPLRKANLEVKVDAILSNPPYIAEDTWAGLQPEVRDFEPRLALVAGPKGTEFHERLLRDSREFLVPGGLLVMELGQGQDTLVRQAAEQIGGYTGIQTVKDDAGIERIIILRRAS